MPGSVGIACTFRSTRAHGTSSPLLDHTFRSYVPSRYPYRTLWPIRSPFRDFFVQKNNETCEHRIIRLLRESMSRRRSLPQQIEHYVTLTQTEKNKSEWYSTSIWNFQKWFVFNKSIYLQKCRKIHGLGCVTRDLVRAWFTQPSPHIFLHFCTEIKAFFKIPP